MLDEIRITALFNPEQLSPQDAEDIGRVLAEASFEGRIDYARGFLHIHGTMTDDHGPANLADMAPRAGVVYSWCPDWDQERGEIFVDGRAMPTDPTDILISSAGEDPIKAAREKLAAWDVQTPEASTRRYAAFYKASDAIREAMEVHAS